MTITLPDLPQTSRLSPEELKLELACALFSQRKISAVAGAQLAGVDFFSFQRSLKERGIELLTEENLKEDVESLNRIFRP
jgi:predicted HTH domain antitoxin